MDVTNRSVYGDFMNPIVKFLCGVTLLVSCFTSARNNRPS